MSSEHSRPWFVNDRACDDFKNTLSASDDQGGDLEMIKTLKIVRSIIVNSGIIAISIYSLSLSGDPTVIGLTALAVLGGYNGLELSDYLALVRAYKEVQQEDSPDQ